MAQKKGFGVKKKPLRKAPKSKEHKTEDERRNAIIAVLKRIPELEGFSDPQFVRISNSEINEWGPDEFIIREGAAKLDQITIILGGTVFIRKRVGKEGSEEYEQVAEIPGPTVIGENSFFTGLTRSAAVYANEKTSGIILTRKDMLRLVSLDKRSFVKFLQNTAEENLNRAERTLVYYMGTLQLALKQATLTKSYFYVAMDDIKGQLRRLEDDTEEWEDMVKDILLFIRDLNEALEELYEFAQLPEILLQSIDASKFDISENNHFRDILRDLTEEFEQMQHIIPLSSINFKDHLITHILTRESEKAGIINYQKIISLATRVYQEISSWHTDMGLKAKITGKRKRSMTEDSPLKKLLWDEVQ